MTDPQRLYAKLIAAFNRYDWPQMADIAQQLLPMATGHAGVQYLAGVAYLELHDLSRALPHLRRAVELDPTRIEFSAQHARALYTARLGNAAKAAADQTMALAPCNAALLGLLGNIYMDSLAHTQAIAAYRQAVSLEPAQPDHRYNLAVALIHAGDIEGSERELENCLAMAPLFWRAHMARSNLRRQTPAHHHIEALQSLLALHGNTHEARMSLHFALAKEHEDLGHYPLAFEHYSQGNAAARETIDYSAEQDAAIFAAMERSFPVPFPFPEGAASAEPIFVFGLPRSGTTLVERILSSHPDVANAGELQNFGMAVRRAWHSPVPFWLDGNPASRMRDINWHDLGTDYVESTRPGTGHTPHFVDKFPFNFLYAGFIAHALPNAKLICLRRHPLDTCLGNFRQLFTEKLPYYHHTFDLLDAGRYYILFDRLMAHWRKVFPNRILEVRYESLVTNQEPETRRLLDHCNLHWHEDCLHFERNTAAVATASSLQVRQPMFRSSLDRWRHYENALTPLIALLHEAGIDPNTGAISQ